jgi:hypothetical protein
MTEQYYFETAGTEQRDLPSPVRERSRKHNERDQGRVQRKHAAAVREIANLQAAITDLERVVLALQLNIDAELESAGVRDPSHFGYPIVARTLALRRDNLKVTVAVLSTRLAELTATAGRVGR